MPTRPAFDLAAFARKLAMGPSATPSPARVERTCLACAASFPDTAALSAHFVRHAECLPLHYSRYVPPPPVCERCGVPAECLQPSWGRLHSLCFPCWDFTKRHGWNWCEAPELESEPVKPERPAKPMEMTANDGERFLPGELDECLGRTTRAGRRLSYGEED